MGPVTSDSSAKGLQRRYVGHLVEQLGVSSTVSVSIVGAQ